MQKGTTLTSGAVLLAVLGLMTPGCGATLEQLRSTPPVTQRVDHDASCVYARLQRTAIEHQTCDLCAQLVWTGNWDPTLEEGIVYAHVTYYEFYPIMFTVRSEGSDTVIEKRVPQHYLSRYAEIADTIFATTDYSRCPRAEPQVIGRR